MIASFAKRDGNTSFLTPSVIIHFFLRCLQGSLWPRLKALALINPGSPSGFFRTVRAGAGAETLPGELFRALLPFIAAAVWVDTGRRYDIATISSYVYPLIETCPAPAAKWIMIKIVVPAAPGNRKPCMICEAFVHSAVLPTFGKVSRPSTPFSSSTISSYVQVDGSPVVPARLGLR